MNASPPRAGGPPAGDAPRPTGPGSDAALLAPLGLRGPGFLAALEAARAAGDAGRELRTWLEVGDALGAVGRWDRAKVAWMRGLDVAEGSARTRSEASSFHWRMGQLSEGTRELGEAAAWYERAAETFRREGASADEAVARMALARVVFHGSGAGLAKVAARDAVLCARDANDLALIGEALELTGEIAYDLGAFDESVASLRDAVKQHEQAGHETGRVRATVALSEVLSESGQSLAAVRAIESVEALLESHESTETRGRGMGLLGLFQLELGQVDEAAQTLKKAHEWLEASGSRLRRSRLLVATARRVEKAGSRADAKPLYEQAWDLARAASDRLRLAPIAYALARCHLDLGDPVSADSVIIVALRLVQEAADLEGLAYCTELAVRIAVRLAQGQLALDRLLMLARTRGQMGDARGEIRTLKDALIATLKVPDTDLLAIAAELMEAIRRAGVSAFGPTETMEIADAMAAAGRPDFAHEIGLVEVERHLAEGRRTDAARTLIRAAHWAVAAEDRATAVDAWDQAIAIGQSIGLAEVEAWEADRAWAAEG
ncbi:MAG: hypothetical protein JNJ59_26505 [Deltaproteobacteria bacterium]|nr:hypothetical protein [Deltaproteobacteria bacterium]